MRTIRNRKYDSMFHGSYVVSCFLLIACCLLPAVVFSQYTKYWIQFADKNNTPHSISNPSTFLSARSIQRRHNQNILIVQNDLPITPSYYDSVKKVSGVTVLNHSKWFNAVTIFTADTNALNTIKGFSFVSNTKPVQRYHSGKRVKEKFNFVLAPVQLNGSEKRASSYDYGPSFNQIDMIGGVCMHNQGFDGKGMVIAVLDAGFYRVDSLSVFDSLRTNKQILGTWDFVDKDTMVYDSDMHGTMVLSTMGGHLPGMLVGTAPKAKYWLFRTEETASEYVIEEDNWVSAAEYADSAGADILTTSLGYTEFDDPAQNHTYADMDGNTAHISIGTDIAVSKGMFAVCSAGNSGGSPWQYIGAPADADSVLAVGAVDASRNYASFSSTGPTFDKRVKPNVAAQGLASVVSDVGTGITSANGTSFSCPITAGMVACLWQAHPASTNMELFRAIQESASQYNAPDSLLGHGISDFCKANLALSVQDNIPSEDVLNIYPNPFNESTSVIIQGMQGKDWELKIFDIVGNLVYQQMIYSQLSILNPKLARGMYVLQVKNENRMYSAKLVKY